MELKLFKLVAVYVPGARISYAPYLRTGDEDLHLRSPRGLVPIDKYVLVRNGAKPVFYIGHPFPGHPIFQGGDPNFSVFPMAK